MNPFLCRVRWEGQGCLAVEGVLLASMAWGDVVGSWMGSAVTGAMAGRAEGCAEAGSTALALERGGREVVHLGGERVKILQVHSKLQGSFLHAPRTWVPEPCIGWDYLHTRSPKAMLPLCSGLSGAHSGEAEPGPHSLASSGSSRSPVFPQVLPPHRGSELLTSSHSLMSARRKMRVRRWHSESSHLNPQSTSPCAAATSTALPHRCPIPCPALTGCPCPHHRRDNSPPGHTRYSLLSWAAGDVYRSAASC